MTDEREFLRDVSFAAYQYIETETEFDRERLRVALDRLRDYYDRRYASAVRSERS